MIEKIRLENDEEIYTLSASGNDVVVVLCLSGKITIRDFWNQNIVYATLNPDETWTLSAGWSNTTIKSEEPTGSTFLLVRYFRS